MAGGGYALAAFGLGIRVATLIWDMPREEVESM